MATLRGLLSCAPYTQSVSDCIFDNQFQYLWQQGIHVKHETTRQAFSMAENSILT